MAGKNNNAVSMLWKAWRAMRPHCRMRSSTRSAKGIAAERIRKQSSSVRCRSKKRTRLHKAIVSQQKLSRGCESGCCPVRGPFFAQDLAFHHVMGKKEMVIGSSRRSIEARLAEMEKCLVLCHICHARYHHGHISLDEAILERWGFLQSPAVMVSKEERLLF